VTKGALYSNDWSIRSSQEDEVSYQVFRLFRNCALTEIFEYKAAPMDKSSLIQNIVNY